MTIRRALFEDLPQIVGIYNQAVVHTVATFDIEPKTVAEREPWFREHDERFAIFVAQAPEVIGWVSLSRWSDRCAYEKTCEISLYVDESHQGEGIGKVLLRQSLDHAKTVGFHTVLSRVTTGNAASVHLHHLFDFRRVGTLREVGFKQGRFLDVELFQLMLK